MDITAKVDVFQNGLTTREESKKRERIGTPTTRVGIGGDLFIKITLKSQHNPYHYSDKAGKIYFSLHCEKNSQETSLILTASFKIDSIFPLIQYHFIGINCTVEIYEYIRGIRLKRLMICQCVIIAEFIILCGDVNCCFLHDAL